ncbi:MAG: DegT/DnrJ/EryC1/StrS family aminotransferase, partial [Candidatus Riflebacteria bacterium]|nr:DegT/DnrJ/EryC1/StrS family aminotransferase [Candidatus Riflebacteria bacterium]
ILERVTFNGVAMDGRQFLERAARVSRQPRFEQAQALATPPRPRLAADGGEPVSPRFIYFGQPLFDKEEEDAVVQTIRSGWVGMGPKCQQFEKEFGEYVGNPRSVSLSSCTAALHLSLVLLGVGPGREVVTTPLTFAATVNAIEHVGATPVFADIDPKTWNLDPSAVEAALTPRTAALIPVHFAGLPCDMRRLEALASARGLGLVEDAAHAVGAVVDGRRIGNSSNLVCFSFYANKNLTTVEGGMLCCPREDLAARARSLRQHGLGQDAWARFRTKELIMAQVLEPGFKYNFTDLQAVIGLAQLRKLERMQAIRDELAAEYDRGLEGLDGLQLQYRPVGDLSLRHALHLYAVLLDPDRFQVGRNSVVGALRAENIGVGIHYEPLVQHPYYRKKYGFRGGEFPVAERVGRGIMSLPISPTMTVEDARTVVKAVRKVLDEYRRE